MRSNWPEGLGCPGDPAVQSGCCRRRASPRRFAAIPGVTAHGSEPSAFTKRAKINAGRRIPSAASISGPELQRGFLVAERNAQRRLAVGKARDRGVGARGSESCRGGSRNRRTALSKLPVTALAPTPPFVITASRRRCRAPSSCLGGCRRLVSRADGPGPATALLPARGLLLQWHRSPRPPFPPATRRGALESASSLPSISDRAAHCPPLRREARRLRIPPPRQSARSGGWLARTPRRPPPSSPAGRSATPSSRCSICAVTPGSTSAASARSSTANSARPRSVGTMFLPSATRNSCRLQPADDLGAGRGRADPLRFLQALPQAPRPRRSARRSAWPRPACPRCTAAAAWSPCPPPRYRSAARLLRPAAAAASAPRRPFPRRAASPRNAARQPRSSGCRPGAANAWPRTSSVTRSGGSGSPASSRRGRTAR